MPRCPGVVENLMCVLALPDKLCAAAGLNTKLISQLNVNARPNSEESLNLTFSSRREV